MSINKPLFDVILNDCNIIIEKSRDSNLKKKQKELVKWYNKIIDSDNAEYQEFYALVHEIKTYDLLKRLNLNPISNNDSKKGPDYNTNLGYVECVTFSKPTDTNSKRILSGSFNRYKAYEPRVTQSLNEKTSKFNDYTKARIIDANRARVICINPGICGFDIHSLTFYEIMQKALFGIGTLYINISKVENELDREYRGYERVISKPKNNADINVDCFSDSSFENISAVLLINNLPHEKFELACLFINPNASVKIDKRKTGKFLVFERTKKDLFSTSLNGKAMSYSEYEKRG